MTFKQYRKAKIIISFVLAMIFAQFIIYRNFWMPVALLAVASLGMLLLRRRVKEVIADERDFQIGGKAALLAMQVFCWVSVVVMFALYANSGVNSAFEVIAQTLAYSACSLLILYSVIFRIYSRPAIR